MIGSVREGFLEEIWGEGGTGVSQVREGHFTERIHKSLEERARYVFFHETWERFVKVEHGDMEGRGNGADASSSGQAGVLVENSSLSVQEAAVHMSWVIWFRDTVIGIKKSLKSQE